MVSTKSADVLTITVFGLGFVGLTTALGFAHFGYKVYGIDVDETRKNILREGHLPFLEPDMEEVLQKHLNHNFFITDDPAWAVSESQIIYYCVGTPYGKDGEADLTYLFQAIDETIRCIDDDMFRILVIKSTIPPSTTAEKIEPYVRSKGMSIKKAGVANNPEFLREGHCWEDFLNADRIVLGTNDPKSRDLLTKLYEPMQVPIKCVSQSTGEFIKYLSNTLLATLISYSNEMADVADTIGDIEISEAFRILHMDKRWNHCNMTTYVYPGCGYGGYCLPKDTNALLAQSKAKGFTPRILENVIHTNDHRPETIAQKIAKELSADATIGVLGLSFKPLSDDVRDTPAARIIRSLEEAGYHNIIAYDPEAMNEFADRYPELSVKMKDSSKEVYDQSDTIAILTAWDEFREVPSLGQKPVHDCRYML